MINWIELIIAILSAVLTIVVVPWIREKTDAERRTALLNFVTIAVQAAEQMYTGSGQGTEKKRYVRDWLKKQGVDFEDADVWDQVDAMIESAVLELKKE